jgi:hypothetical protein
VHIWLKLYSSSHKSLDKNLVLDCAAKADVLGLAHICYLRFQSAATSIRKACCVAGLHIVNKQTVPFHHTMLLAGLVGALLLFAAVATLESFTMYVLAKYAERYDASSYGSLIRRALGRKTGAGLSAVTVLYLWGSSVAYLVSSCSRSWVAR